MQNKEIKDKILKLRTELEKHNYLYHVLDTPEISDTVYDSMLHELIRIEKEYPEYDDAHSVTKRAGGKVLDHFEKVTHDVRQWSFDNVFDFTELTEWEERNLKIINKSGVGGELSYVTELKIDGLKVVLTYQSGVLVRAATRGDGEVGEDVTENVKTIKSVPLVLKDKIDCTVIGEVWIKQKDLKKINEEQRVNEKSLYANTRNLAAGTLRQLDSSVVAKRNLQMFCYDVEGSDFKTQIDVLEFLKENKFLVNPHFRLCKDLREVQAEYDKWKGRRNEEEYGVDGLVIKTNEKDIWYTLGYTSKAPRAGIAYKFPAEEVSTTVESITLQVGRTGVVTPVAELRPVLVYGSRVKRATLHNIEEIERLDVRVGDTVVVRKAGDVIPEIVSVIVELRNKNAKKFIMPTACPVCDTRLEREENKLNKSGTSVGLFCKNEACEAKHREYFSYFVSKKAFDVDGMGEKIVDSFYDLGLIKNVLDIFKLKREDIEGLEGFGEKSADNLINAIENSKNILPHKFLYALGIRHVGETTAKDLIRHFGSFENFKNILDELIRNKRELKENNKLERTIKELKEEFAVDGIGEKSLESLISWFAEEKNKIFLSDILKIVKFKEKENLSNSNDSNYTNLSTAGNINSENLNLSGKTFVITGSLSKSREHFVEIIESFGGKVSGSVSSKTGYLLLGSSDLPPAPSKGWGAPSMSSKEKIARELNIQILNESEFNDMISK